MVQRQRRLDQPGDAGGGLGVADHRLDRADRRLTRRDPVLADELGGALQLGAVAGDGAGAVRLEQADARRPEPGHLVGAAHRPQLARGQRRGQALGVAVAAAADALDHRVDPVAVALGIGEALERHHGDAFGDDDAVGRGIEGRAAAARRQRLRLAEAEVAEGSLHRVDAAGDDEVAAARHQLGDALVDRRQRRGAGRVDGEVDAAEIEPVGDPPGDDVEQDAGERVLGPLGQPVGHVGRERAAEARQLGAQPVLRADVAGAAAGADDHRGALAVEGLLVIAGVLDRLPRHLERHQLHRVDRGDRLRRHAVAHRIERHVVEEAAPLRVDLVLGGAVGVEVEAPVPAMRRDLGDRVDLVEDVLPVLAGRVRLGQDAGDADDRDVGRRVGVASDRRLDLVEPALQQRRRAFGDLAMQGLDPRHLRAQGRDLAEHVHALRRAARSAESDSSSAFRPRRVRPFEAMRSRPRIRSSRIARLSSAGMPFSRCSIRIRKKSCGERRVGAAAGVAGPRLEVDRALAVDHLLLELRHDRAAGDDLLGEEVGAAHQDADLGAARDQRRGQHLHHRRGRGVVDAAGEQQLDLAARDGVLRQLRGQAIDHRAPEHEAAERADVAAALPAFEDEAARAFLQEQRNQVGRGHVQEGRHPGRLEAHRLVGPAAGDDRVARPERGGAGELLVEQRLRREAEQADAPGAVAEQLLGVGEQAVERRSLEQREGDHRQGAAVGDRRRRIRRCRTPGSSAPARSAGAASAIGRAAQPRRSVGLRPRCAGALRSRCRSPAARPRHAGTAFATGRRSRRPGRSAGGRWPDRSSPSPRRQPAAAARRSRGRRRERPASARPRGRGEPGCGSTRRARRRRPRPFRCPRGCRSGCAAPPATRPRP